MKKYIAIIVVAFTCFLLGGCGDKTAPTIEGVKETVDVQCGTDFNLTDYVSKKIEIKDDSDEEPEVVINCDKKVYDNKTGKVNTGKDGEYKVKITAKDAAANTTEKEFTLRLNPIHVTKDNKTPVIYDGKYAKIRLKEFSHGDVYGTQGYHIKTEVENKTDEDLSINLTGKDGLTVINKHQISVYVFDDSDVVGAGLINTVDQSIEDSDIPDDIGTIKEIKTTYSIKKAGSDKRILTIPVIIDVNVAD
jgi:predicted small secreted protein